MFLVKKWFSSGSLFLAQMPLLCLDLSINISAQFFNWNSGMFPLSSLKTMFGKDCGLFRSVELVIVSQDTEGWLVTLSYFWLELLQVGVTRPSSYFPVLTLVVTLLLQTCRQYYVLDISHSFTYKKLSWKSWYVGKVCLWVLILIQRKGKWK